MTRQALVAIVLCLRSGAPLSAQGQSPGGTALLLDHLIGQWHMVGTARGKPVNYALTGRRVLQGRYVELHMEDTHRPAAYEAVVLIGADTTATGVVAHWLDSFGAAYSVPPATGEVRGDTLFLTFPYSTGAFYDMFCYNPKADTWIFRLERADSSGSRHLFAAYSVHRR